MNKHLLLFGLITLGVWHAVAQIKPAPMPVMVRNNDALQLLVDGKPYLILGCELGNSSASYTPYMKPIWSKLKKMNVNTIYTPVYWELMEPAEGKFNFSLIDDMIVGARSHQIKLVLLWFGSWKNSISCYAPEWVKNDPRRFPRATDKNGKQQEIMTPFSQHNMDADKKAFVKLMGHLKAFDSKQHTVIMIQVENEIGMLPDARSYDAAANTAFEQPLPAKLMNYLQASKSTLMPETTQRWKQEDFKTNGNWEAIFGKSLATDEAFMAWYFAVYTNEIAATGKAVYNLPMYLNAALNRPGKKPGEYPSAGPLPQVADIWKAGAPAIDVLAPDFYNPDFKYWCDLYTRAAAPLLIPEIHFEEGVDAKAFFAFGNYNCISFSPFSIESTDKPEKEPIGKAYGILKQLAPLITQYGPKGNIRGFLLDKDNTSTTFTLGNYIVTASHDNKLGWTAESKNSIWPQSGGMIIMLSPDEFYVAGTGIVLTFQSVKAGKVAGLLSIDEGRFINQVWSAGRRLNGDQDHQGRHVRIPVGEYDIQHVKLYVY